MIFPLTSTLECPHAEAAAIGERFHATYVAGAPFSHIALDDFLDPALLDGVLEDIACLPEAESSFNRPQERLKTSYAPEALPPHTRNLFWFFNSRPFIAFLEKLTGILGLMGDPYYLGGGIHRVGNGGHLDIHADFNHVKKLNLERRLNVLIYLNKEWKSEYGGQFEIWDRLMSTRMKSFEPLFNRCVVFTTDSNSYHGNPTPVNHPGGQPRLSMALYYYTATWDAVRRARDTQFKARPNSEDRFDWNVSLRETVEDLTPPLLMRAARKMARGLSRKIN